MRKIDGRQAVAVDECDAWLLDAHRWQAVYCKPGQCYYVMASMGGKTIYLHRMIMDPPPGMTVDHINGDPLDNRRCNLRLATRSQNQMNRRTQSNNTSGFKGVSLFKRTGKYRAYIMVAGKETHLGYFATAEEASAAYQAALAMHHGDFARRF